MPEPLPLTAEEKSPIFGDDGKLKEDLRIEIVDEKSIVLLPEGTSCNTHKWEIFSTADDDQGAIDITLYRGKEEIAKNNHRIGKFQITDIPAAKRGRPQIGVVFSITNDTIQIAAQDMKRRDNMIIKQID